ncbi:hypothetical protein GVAV_001562 [Gurleya vavrai]
MHGRKPNLPYCLDFDNKTETSEERIIRIRKIQEEAMQRRREAQTKKIKEIKDDDKLKIGDLVMYKKQILPDKLSPKWEGPFIIISTQNYTSFVLSDINHELTFVAHRKQLKRIAKDNEILKARCDHQSVLEDDNVIRDGGIVDIDKVKRIKLNCICLL